MIIDAPDEVQTIACRRLGCLGRVLFVPSRIPDFFRTPAARESEPLKKRVYMTCDNVGEQHEYQYEVTLDAGARSEHPPTPAHAAFDP